MRQAALLGNPGTKRTQYLQQAAGQAGLFLAFLDWQDWRRQLLQLTQEASHGIFLKIDPPLWESCTLGDLERLIGGYQLQLQELGHAAGRYDIQFFNHPAAITGLLDKGACKERLLRAGLPVTELLARTLPCGKTAGSMQPPVQNIPIIHNAAQLLDLMQRRGIFQVFIKPVHGSGAAGVSALRWQQRSGQMALYTCAMEHPQIGLANTRRLRRLSDTAAVLRLLDRLLGMECILERWHAKAQYQGYSYDLRAVVQDGRLDYLLARLSKGPITNLQLNNRPLGIDMLGLLPPVLDEIADLCQKALALYPGLTSAGIDILLEKGSLKPRIIEMNGQGDLIYQDIYHQNIIYRHQACLLKERITSVRI